MIETKYPFTEEDILLRRSIRDFCRDKIIPYRDKWDEEERCPVDLFPELGELGFLGVYCPQEDGGSGTRMVTASVLMEELGYADAGFGQTVFAHIILAVTPLWKWGTEAQKEKYLRPSLKGRLIGGLGITEPNVGSDVASLEMRARKTDGGYLLNGTKMFTTNGTVADYIIFAASLDKQKARKGIALFIVDKGTPGFSAKPLKKMGIRSSDTAEVILEDCEISGDQLLGAEEEGFYGVMKAFTGERILAGSLIMGTARAAFDVALDYAKKREQFGQPIGRYQAIKHTLADMVKDIEVGLAITYQTAALMDAGRDCRIESAVSKLFTSEVVSRVCYKAVQIHGGYGMMSEFPVNRFFRDSRQFEIGAGTSEIMREIIGRSFDI
jgi:alkylation response protein AidB-like acyl-CoA dehydrogenase